MPSALEILEKKITKITNQIESMDKSGGKKRKRVREESGESGEDKEDKGEVQGPREDPELVGRMKELGESFEWVREEMGDELKGMEKDMKMVRMEVTRLFGASGDREAGPGEAQSRISMGDLLGQVECPKFQTWAVGFPNAIGWSVVQNMVAGASAARVMVKALEEMGAGDRVPEEYQRVLEAGGKPGPSGSGSNN
ncbi:hypothetical protein FISHEDRAFT_73925 [Fistulina hepatica ATCC 64428]|uniref:Uncharacterized protein n=1 Tax=Fistulina hepatica ATCC 64428 TaxID=1128425 RepID=A0A0D7ACG7_9AGAR|nr:hypothetical protein FISHEDRAFT_73925 [Fistulina hepatica ATCC 64428]